MGPLCASAARAPMLRALRLPRLWGPLGARGSASDGTAGGREIQVRTLEGPDQGKSLCRGAPGKGSASAHRHRGAEAGRPGAPSSPARPGRPRPWARWGAARFGISDPARLLPGREPHVAQGRRRDRGVAAGPARRARLLLSSRSLGCAGGDARTAGLTLRSPGRSGPMKCPSSPHPQGPGGFGDEVTEPSAGRALSGRSQRGAGASRGRGRGRPRRPACWLGGGSCLFGLWT